MNTTNKSITVDNILVLNALMLKNHGCVSVELVETELGPRLIADKNVANSRVFQIYLTPDWDTVEQAAIDLDVTYAIFSTDVGLKASVTKDAGGTQVRLVFPIKHDGNEAGVILQRILELFVRTQTWTLNPNETIPGWGKQCDELFGCVD